MVVLFSRTPFTISSSYPSRFTLPQQGNFLDIFFHYLILFDVALYIHYHPATSILYIFSLAYFHDAKNRGRMVALGNYNPAKGLCPLDTRCAAFGAALLMRRKRRGGIKVFACRQGRRTAHMFGENRHSSAAPIGRKTEHGHDSKENIVYQFQQNQG